jgi:tetratricopeptide (TPR) repeat protein
LSYWQHYENGSVIKKFLAIICASLFASCAAPLQTPVNSDSEPSAVPEIKPDEHRSESQPNAPGPVAAISPDLLYLLLSAEIAGQRGDFDVSLDHYLEAARRTRDARVAERAVQIALFVKDTDKALEALAIWVAVDPNSASARKVAILLYLQEGKREEALEQIKALLAMQEEDDFESTLFDIAGLVEKEASDDALSIMSELARFFPDKAEVHYTYAGLALNREKLTLALEEVRKALALRSDWRRALLLEAEIIVKMGDEQAARDVFRDALEKTPDDTRLRMVYARYLVKLGDYTAAESQFARIVAEQPEDHDALFALALVRLQLKQEALAKKVLKQLLTVPKWRDQASLYLGRLEAENGRIDAALHWFDRVSNGPMALEAGLNAVSVAASNDRLSEAYTRLHQLRERFPKQQLRFYLIEAEILNNKKDYQGAFSLLTRALNEMPGQPELLYTRALTAERLNRLDVLEADLKAILAENPDDANALNALGYTLADRTQRYEESLRYLERAIELKPDDPVVIDSYGWLQYRLGHYDLALEYLQRAYRLVQDPEIGAHLGEVLWVMGRRVAAESIWKEVLEKEPDNESIQKVRSRLIKEDGT